MGELGGVRKYLYWSQRRIEAIAADNGIGLESTVRKAVKTPSLPGFPQAEFEQGPLPLDRPAIAGKIERAIGQEAVSDFVTPPPVRFARGIGTIVFSQFLDWNASEPSRAVAFTSTTSSNGCRVAVCMFGSVDNLADIFTDSSPRVKGWTSSSAPDIAEFLATPYEYSTLSPHELAIEAIKIGCYEGESHDDENVLRRPWKRGFTYGHIGDTGEWLCEVYIDVELEPGFDNTFDRAVVGAPLWIRTPTIRALRLYDEYSEPELDKEAGFSRWKRRATSQKYWWRKKK